ncbi:MAG: 4-(cytidine 5'-diphospho)-2-C-methyl-D-erythritol kinase [Taibaiella sp.]|nr:4-(cytidine 5'-diphospho)-2-C-methyl-D-erythritol kinase [Taibaiella sp.]
MIRFPNCKINIGLYVTNVRSDGYHDIETVFYPVPLRDGLEIVPAGKTELQLYGRQMPGEQNTNLVWKAYELLQGLYPDKVKPVAIHLLKNIPMGAGMGGGSADGAFMLQLLTDYFELGVSNKELEGLALQLGSDCPFFINNKPAYARGRGEVLEPIELDLSAYSIQLVCPNVHVSTADAFKTITPKAAPINSKEIAMIPVREWKDRISNDFEKPVFAKHPELKEIKEQLYAGGALYAAMSGSGSTVYGVFEKGVRAEINTVISLDEYYLDSI